MTFMMQCDQLLAILIEYQFSIDNKAVPLRRVPFVFGAEELIDGTARCR